MERGRNRGGIGQFVNCNILEKINSVENAVYTVAEAEMLYSPSVHLGEDSAVVIVRLNVTALSPGNGVLLLGIPWSLVSVADLCLNVLVEAEIVQ